jgi:hypothetical protein
MPRRSRSLPAPWTLALALLAAACAEPADTAGPREPWPPDTVLLVAGRPVGSADVDPLAAALLEIEPASSLAHRRRLAVLRLALPLECGRALAQEGRRQQALAEAQAFAASLNDLAGAAEGPQHLADLEERAGDFRLLGIPLWHVAQGLEVGAWSEVREVPGAFVLVKLLARSEAARGDEREFVLLEARFPYADDLARIEALAAQARVLPVDPAWDSAVPGLLRYRDGTSISPEDSNR